MGESCVGRKHKEFPSGALPVLGSNPDLCMAHCRHPSNSPPTQAAMHLALPFAPLATVPVHGSHLRFPVRRIYCVGRNYAAHAQEMGFSGREAPFFFMKPADAVLAVPSGTTGVMPYPPQTSELHHEIELVVAVGKEGANIAADQAASHVWGYAVGLDMTRRDLQAQMKKQGRPWCIAKGFDASAPIGPITPAALAGEITSAAIWLNVNGQERQRSRTDQLLWSVAETIEHLSKYWTLQPGDLIFTGTPEGVGAVARGDALEGGIEGLEPLRVTVA